jgi:hypothetical protein
LIAGNARSESEHRRHRHESAPDRSRPDAIDSRIERIVEVITANGREQLAASDEPVTVLVDAAESLLRIVRQQLASALRCAATRHRDESARLTAASHAARE